MTIKESDLKRLADLVRSYNNDFPKFAEEQLRIADNEGNVIPFKLNSIQLRLEKVIKDLEDSGQPVRIKILKSRRLGCSTYIAGRYFRRIWNRPGHNSEIITHLSDASRKILEKLQLFSDNIDPKFQLPRVKSNASEIVYKNSEGLMSRCGIKTAENPDALRSSTNQSLHLSEVAFWNNAEECALASLQTVARKPGTSIIVETTANGVGGYFYDFWYDDNGYVPIFFGWQEFEDYKLPVPKDFKITEEEQTEMRRLNLSMEQIVWRRQCIKENCSNSLSKFMQEYPGTPEDAFQASGQCRFDTARLREMEANGLIGTPLFSGSINVRDNGVVDLYRHPDRDSLLRIWQPYEKRKQYVSFCDVSEGITNDKGKTGDKSVIKVFDLEGYKQVAEWVGLLEPSDVGLLEVYLAKAYGACIIVQEINNHGHAAMSAITKIAKYPRELIFTQTAISENEFNGVVRLGWQTSSHTRALAIDDLAVSIQRGNLFRITKEDLRELYSFTSKVSGRKIKFEASSGSHDDRVITLAIAEHLLRSDLFMRRYRLRAMDWQVCNNCRFYNRGKCSKINVTRDRDDVCRLYSQYSPIDVDTNSDYKLECI